MKANIVIASTLKPVIDPRAYEKFGRSIAASGEYKVHILGSLPTDNTVKSPILLYPISPHTKGSVKRILLPWKILSKLFKIKPELLIINTHELLFIGVLYKLFTGRKLVYDIRENYYFNLLYQNNYPIGIRNLLAFYVRTKEILLASFIDHFLLAEKCYVDEIKFIKQRFTIVENKYLPIENKGNKEAQLDTEFLISGTISKEYGVFDAVRFFKQLPKSKYKLIIVGHCPNIQTSIQLKNEVQDEGNIELLISDTPIPYRNILIHIGSKTIGLLPYQTNKSTKNKIPTKLYEYIGLGIPVLISRNPIWEKIIQSYHAGLSIDFNSPVVTDDISQFITLNIASKQPDLKNIMWNTEEGKLLSVINSLIS